MVDPPAPPTRRQLLVVHRPDLQTLAQDAAHMAKGQKSLFFCQSRATTEAVAEFVRRAGTAVFVHHSAVSREERALAEERFHQGSDACIVCTSTLELGIDVGDLDRVLQAEAPGTVGSFLQRMGRTGRRAGQTANTTFFCESSDGVLQAIALIELAKARWVESVAVDPRCWPVFIHQLLVMALASEGIPPAEAWSHLSQVPDFQEIERREFDELVNWMLHDGGLRQAGGRLVLGPKAERLFGRRNFMELYAVFSSPQSYTVQTTEGRPLGSLNQEFVDRLVDDISCFLLGGRPWAVMHVQHDDCRVIVVPAPRGREPTWGGFLPQFLSYHVSQRILNLLTDSTEYGYLDDPAAAILAQQRHRMCGILRPGVGGISTAPDEVRWWTFAGGRINATLRYALETFDLDWKIVSDNFAIRVYGSGLDAATFRQHLAPLHEDRFWDDAELWRGVIDALPNYRLSKFQPLMPDWVEREVVARYLLDVAGARVWVENAFPELNG